MPDLWRHREGEKVIPETYSRSQLQAIIDEWVIGTYAERDRKIISRRLLDGITIEGLAEEFDLSVSQIKRVIQKRSLTIFKHASLL